MALSPEEKKARANLRRARSEIKRAVERFAEVTDPLRGHRLGAVREARALADDAEKLVRQLER